MRYESAPGLPNAAPGASVTTQKDNPSGVTFDRIEQGVVTKALDTIRKGDVFDSMRHFRGLRWVGGVTLMGIVADIIYPVTTAPGSAATPGEIGMTAATVAVTTAAGPLVRAHERKKAQRVLKQQQALSNVVGTQTEFMTSRDKERKDDEHPHPLNLRWYGTDKEDPSPTELRGHLARIAAVSQIADIDHIVLPLAQVKPHLPAREDFGQHLDQTDWMYQEKHRELWDERDGEEELVVVNQHELSELITGVEVPKGSVTLDTILHTLKKVHPMHRAHQWYEQLSNHQDQAGDDEERVRANATAREIANKKLAHIFQAQIDRPLEDITLTYDEDDLGKFIAVSRFVGTTTLTDAGKKLMLAGKDAAAEIPEAAKNGGENGKKEKERIENKRLLVGLTALTQGGEFYVKWQNPHAWHEQYRSPVHLNITAMCHMILNPDAYPAKQVTEACEQAAWLTLQGISFTLMEGEGKHAPSEVISLQDAPQDVSIAGTIQKRTYMSEYGEKGGIRRNRDRSISLNRTSKLRRTAHSAPYLIAAAAGGLIIGFGANKIVTNADIKADNALYAQARADGYKDWHGDPKITDAVLNRIFSQVYNEDPLYRYFGGPITTVLGDVYNLTGSFERGVNGAEGVIGLQYTSSEMQSISKGILGTQPKECALCDAPTGNVDTNTKNEPVWYLQSYNGMSTEGYWVQSVFNHLYEGMTWQSPYNIYTPGINKSVDDARPLLQPDQLDKTKPLVSIQQQVEFNFYNNSVPKFNPAYYTVDNNIVMPIPVLRDAHVEAATLLNPTAYINGAPAVIRLATLPDGTQALVMPRMLGTVETVQFWLAPGKGEELHASLPVQPDGYVKPSRIDAEWEKILGRPLPKDPAERLQVEVDFIRNHFLYSLDPLKNENVINDRRAFAKAVLTGEKANCNVAASLLAISNPDLLNIVTGYLSSDPRFILGHDAHEWNLTSQGQLDATPTNMTDAEAKKSAQFESISPDNSGHNNNGSSSSGGSGQNFTSNGNGGLESPAQQRQVEFWKALDLLGEIVIAAGVFWQRERILRGVNKVGAWNAARSLDHRSTESMQLAHDALQFGLYSGKNEGLQADRERRAKYAVQEPPTSYELLDFFWQYATPETMLHYTKLLRQREHESTDPALTAGLHDARKIIKGLYKEDTRTVKSDADLQADRDEALAERMTKAKKEAAAAEEQVPELSFWDDPAKA